MKETSIPESLEAAAEQFVILLTPEERASLIAVSNFSPLLKGGAEFVGQAMRVFKLDKGEALPLLKNIFKVSPGKLTNMDFMAEIADPLIAAKFIVERARSKLLESVK